MKPSSNNAPVFALDETTDWDDVENAMAASAEYQSSKLGKIIPLMFFAPMTEPDNLDTWEPMKTAPENLLIASIARSADATLLKALELTQLRVVADEGKHGKGKPNPASSVLKIKGSEIQQTTTELLMEVIGPFAAPYDEHGDDGSNETMDWTAQIAPSYFNNRKVSIYGGSNEIQRNIITKAVLGL